jgi:hypothetical protein
MYLSIIIMYCNSTQSYLLIEKDDIVPTIQSMIDHMDPLQKIPIVNKFDIKASIVSINQILN